MNQSEKLEALVRKAGENGLLWNSHKILSFKVQNLRQGYLPVYLETDETYEWEERDEFGDETGVVHKENNGQALSVESLIFNHDFARALFGEEPQHEIEQAGPPDILDNFEHHLQQAVISKDPIDYMYKTIFGKE